MKKKMTMVAYETAVKNIRLAEARITALHFAVNDRRSRGYLVDDAQQEFSALHAVLYSDLNDAYRHLFMFAGLLGGEAQAEANQKALAQYLGESAEIRKYLGLGDSTVVDEEIFRAELNARREGRPVE